ncbi:protein pex26 [Aspergillus saccharolyticus JOP 1030-1]|uniref:Peroxin 26 n=1 Tax=Aspergillus saccharolyticus JOP 1030-1 TaxID=1450539 RepID=A0A318ZE18_9EURO|nr:hypothetical protein BP01DRAFT_340407 [Aspergillus saccharolyticus JOP 1030-1]PYH45619.1 hypothetical protein BP01DRAFT_340407 [Aspergillus saccharolyticus JOP 1030-1]
MADLSASQSQHLSSAITTSPLSPSKICSKTYKKATHLFLTRRLQEALAALQPAITTPSGNDEQFPNGDTSPSAPAGPPPIAAAQPTWRIKVWNLYITLLSAIVELGPEEGKSVFGPKEWKAMSSQVREGHIWETVVQTGYQGHEGSVDAEVVYNLATLLLRHMPSQQLNQQRLETYLSSSGQPDLNITEQHLRDNSSSTTSLQRANGGTDTPKDLNARVRIIELFTLHVLPRNDEWEYAQEFISLSEVLDDERKDVFLQTLEGLKEEKQQGELRAAALQREKDAELERQAREAERRRLEEDAAAAAAAAATEQSQPKGHGRSSSEVDYGIEKTYPNGSVKGRGKSSNGRQAATGRTAFSPSGSKSVKKTDKPAEARAKRSQALTNVVRNLMRFIAKSIAGNSLSVARTILFLLGILFALSRQDIRERVRRITGAGWQKVKGTIGMGVKVSYI